MTIETLLQRVLLSYTFWDRMIFFYYGCVTHVPHTLDILWRTKAELCVCVMLPTRCVWWWCPGSWAVWSEPEAAPQWGWAAGTAAGSPCCYLWSCCTNPGCSVWLETQRNTGLLQVFSLSSTWCSLDSKVSEISFSWIWSGTEQTNWNIMDKYVNRELCQVMVAENWESHWIQEQPFIHNSFFIA